MAVASAITLVKGTVPATPATDKVSVYVDSATGVPSYVDDAGVQRSLKGAGVPAGGTTGQALIKVDGTDYNAAWTTLASGQAAIQYKDEGSNIGTAGAVTAVNFVGAGVTASHSSGTVTVTIPGAATEAVTALTITSGTVTLDFAGKSRASFTLALNANVTTVNFSNLAGSGLVTEFDLQITQDGTGGRTFALPAALKALGGSDTAIASAANAVTLLSAKTFDNGTTWRYAMQESA